MSHKIRPATPEDVAAVEAVRVATWKSAYRGIMPDDYLDGLAVDPERVERMVAGLAVALAEGRTPILVGQVDGRVVGYINFGRSREDGIEGAWIFAIYVLPEAQSAGLGRDLMAAAVERLRADGYTEVGLWVASDNMPTRRFYERFGMVASGRAQPLPEPYPPVEEMHYRMSL